MQYERPNTFDRGRGRGRGRDWPAIEAGAKGFIGMYDRCLTRWSLVPQA